MSEQYTDSGLINQPHLMDKIYRNQRFIYNASRKYYLLGRDELISELSPPVGAKVLELGCGTGRNLICAAKRYTHCDFYGVDISTEMLKTAGNSIFRAKLQNNIHLAQGDATNFNPEIAFGEASFERIFISFSLSMIPEWQSVITNALLLLKPGGELHIVDFGECKQYPYLFRKALYGWLSLFHVHPIANFPFLLSDIAEQNDARSEIKNLYGSYSVKAVLKKLDDELEYA